MSSPAHFALPEPTTANRQQSLPQVRLKHPVIRPGLAELHPDQLRAATVGSLFCGCIALDKTNPLFRYEDILGCSKVNLTNTTNLYARYTTTVLCNAIVQSSKQSCGLSDEAATPLCADACVRELPFLKPDRCADRVSRPTLPSVNRSLSQARTYVAPRAATQCLRSVQTLPVVPTRQPHSATTALPP